MTGVAVEPPSPATDLTVRELSGLSELARTVPLAHAVWGADDAPEDPTLLQVVQHTGGLVAGALDARGELWAYLVGLPTREPDLQHSHRLGVHPACRSRGLGEALKRFQRGWCLERGIRRVQWTFDPLLLANAHLNIHRLGATVRSYLPDYYGAMAGINAGVPSDRFEAEWALEGAGRGEQSWPEGEPIHPLHDALPDPLPDALAVRVPADFYRMLSEDLPLARAWREASGPLFTELFARGYVLVDVDRARECYLLRRGAA